MKEIAHVKKENEHQWAEPHWLTDHLQCTAAKAAEFARKFNSESWAYAAGIGHDAGKGTATWQSYLKRESGYDESAHLENITGRVDHSTPSAKLIEQTFGNGIGRILSYCIAGHHTGLPDYIGKQSSLTYRLENSTTESIPEDIVSPIRNAHPDAPPRQFQSSGIDLSLWIRMIFSSLVDADFLDTEEYMDPDKYHERAGYLSIDELLSRFNSHMQDIGKNSPNAEINKIRRTVLSNCRAAAGEDPGFFTLTVPTGGGKTLSSMAFALEHALKHEKDRIIYVIPYTSIIEQNADVFREALGKENVIEHHSNIDIDDQTPKSRLSTENWDAPIIVTTTVQFFESLFAAKTSRCRKLHNICNSVVILDEAQLLPSEYLSPILRALELLVDYYNVTFVICTATQPALEEQDESPEFPGLKKGSVKEIIQDVPALYRSLKRVHVDFPEDVHTATTWEKLAEDLTNHEQVLCIVSDRKSCRLLHSMMPSNTYHLSALMCAQHRSITIARIKADLAEEKQTRVISTQLVEAGVDLDFPVVYRAIAGLDSIAQAAGRCNREGSLNKDGKLGKVVLFIPPKQSPPGILRKAAETASRMIDSGVTDILDQSIFADYFSELYWKVNSLDRKGILDLLKPDYSNLRIQFRSAGDAFQLIDNSKQRNIIVPFDDGEELIALLKSRGPDRWLLRKLQRYSVNIYVNDFNELLSRGSLEEIHPGIFALKCKVEYDGETGLVIQDLYSPESYMV